MTTPLIELAKRLGVPEAMVHHEAFTSPSRVTSESPQSPNALPAAAAGSITFRRTGKKVDHDGNRVILEIAEENGIDLPYDCRSGVCGQCKVKMISGDVVMDSEDALTAGERSTGIILACQARCQNDVTIDA
jgi:ferredoxin